MSTTLELVSTAPSYCLTALEDTLEPVGNVYPVVFSEMLSRDGESQNARMNRRASKQAERLPDEMIKIEFSGPSDVRGTVELKDGKHLHVIVVDGKPGSKKAQAKSGDPVYKTGSLWFADSDLGAQVPLVGYIKEVLSKKTVVVDFTTESPWVAVPDEEYGTLGFVTRQENKYSGKFRFGFRFANGRQGAGGTSRLDVIRMAESMYARVGHTGTLSNNSEVVV